MEKGISRRAFLGSAGVAGGVALVGAAGVAHADEPAAYNPGSYTAAAYGMAGYIRVKVTFDETSITDIQIEDENQTVGICEEVYATIPAAIVENQSLAVDMVAGATVTSAAVISAVSQCVAQAGGDAAALAKVEVPVEVADETFDYDVVVAGAGLAGLGAALKVAQDGARTALLEKQGVTGTSIFASAIMYVAPEESDVDSMYDKWMEAAVTTCKYPTPERVRGLCEAGPEVYEFLPASGRSLR